jgi:phage baseplate assembly protein W
MLPANNAQQEFEFIELPSNTYRINDNIINGFVDGLDAMKQAVYLILRTARYRYLIYSWNYGIELIDLIGEPIALIIPEIKRRITEALLQDTRIISISNFNFEINKKSIHTTFIVNTIYGEINDASLDLQRVIS